MGKVMAFFSIILLFMAMSTGLAAATGQSWVKINNRVGGPINVQCASRDDNLGAHVLQNMQQLAWSVDENFFGTTLFWCNSSGSNAQRMWMSGLAVAFGKLGSYVTDVFGMWHLMASGSRKKVALGSGGSRAGYTRGNCKLTRTSCRQLMYLIHLQLTEYPGITRESSQDNWKRIPPPLT